MNNDEKDNSKVFDVDNFVLRIEMFLKNGLHPDDLEEWERNVMDTWVRDWRQRYSQYIDTQD